jgi:hypothetical protein
MGRYVECECGSRLFDVAGVALTATGKVANFIGDVRCAMCRKTKPPHTVKREAVRGGTRD